MIDGFMTAAGQQTHLSDDFTRLHARALVFSLKISPWVPLVLLFRAVSRSIYYVSSVMYYAGVLLLLNTLNYV